MRWNELNILALDISTKTGWAVSANQVSSGVFDMSKMPDHGQRGFHFHKWLADMIVEYHIDLMVCETSFATGFGKVDYILNGLQFVAHTVAYAHDIKRQTVPPKTIKKFTTGSGKASKDDMVAAVQKMGFPDVTSNDEADAIALLTYAMEKDLAA